MPEWRNTRIVSENFSGAWSNPADLAPSFPICLVISRFQYWQWTYVGTHPGWRARVMISGCWWWVFLIKKLTAALMSAAAWGQTHFTLPIDGIELLWVRFKLGHTSPCFLSIVPWSDDTVANTPPSLRRPRVAWKRSKGPRTYSINQSSITRSASGRREFVSWNAHWSWMSHLGHRCQCR